MLFKKIRFACAGLLIVLVLFSISCSENTESDMALKTMSIDQILKKTKITMRNLNSYQLDLKHSPGPGTPVGNTGLTLSEASAKINLPDDIYIEGNLLFGNIVLKTKYVKKKSDSYYINPITQKWESIEDNSNPLSLAVNGLNEILFSTIDQIESPTIDSSNANSYIIRGEISPSIFDTLLGETLEKSLETKITIDKNLYQINKIEISGQASKYDDPKIIRKLTISNFDKIFDISVPSLK